MGAKSSKRTKDRSTERLRKPCSTPREAETEEDELSKSRTTKLLQDQRSAPPGRTEQDENPLSESRTTELSQEQRSTTQGKTEREEDPLSESLTTQQEKDNESLDTMQRTADTPQDTNGRYLSITEE